MESKQRPKAVRWVAVTLIVGLALAWGGFSVAESAPSSITTCTKIRNNKTKVIASSEVPKCTYKGKGVADTWDHHPVVLAQLAAKDATIAAAKTEACNLFFEVFAPDNELLIEYQFDAEFHAIVDVAASRCFS